MMVLRAAYFAQAFAYARRFSEFNDVHNHPFAGGVSLGGSLQLH
jgi:hypothetical protein